MNPVAIVTDSTACVPEELLSSLDIRTVPYYVHRDPETLRDLVTIQRDEFYQWLPSATILPTSACPGPGDYLQVYQQLAEAGCSQIVSIHMTSKGSGAYQAALAGKGMLAESGSRAEVCVVDTRNVSMCQGWIAIEAARSARDGGSLEIILDQIDGLIPRVRMLQTADTLKYLYMGGRIGRASHLMGSLLNLKPLISMEDGEIVSLGIARSRAKAYQRMVELVAEAAGSTNRIKIAYVHAAAFAEVEKLRALVESRLDVAETLVAELSPALGVHTGPGTAGFCYYPLIR
jgi:DegV family protein with EDD domain